MVGAVEWHGEELADWLLDVLRSVGIDSPDPADDLHKRIVEALAELGRGASFGQRVVAVRWVFNWALRDAGERFATLKADYEDKVAQHVTRVTEEARL
jgi:hypothetical protein